MNTNELRIEMMQVYSSAEEEFSKENYLLAYQNMLKASKIAKKIANLTYDLEDAREFKHLSEHYDKKASFFHDMIDDPKRKHAYVMEAPTKGFSDFIGLEGIKKYLLDGVIKQWKNHILNQREQNGILFYGPHGVGKTRFVHSLIMELNAKAYYIQPLKHFSMSDFASVENSFINFFSKIEKEDNVILFIESPVPYFSNGEDEFSKDSSELFIRLFKNELKRIKRKNLNILLIATTSSPDKLSKKALGNKLFDEFIRIHLPDVEIRKGLIERYFKDKLTPERKEMLLNRTEGYVTSSVTRLCKEILEAQAFEENAFKSCLDNFIVEDVSGYETNVDEFEKSIQSYSILK